MSSVCPKCGTELTQDFGLVTCGVCEAVLSIDVDGNVQIARDDYHQETGIQQTSEPLQSAELAVPFNSEPQAEQIQAEVEPEATQNATVFQEIQDFGNKETSAGPLSYSITIENIDVPERVQAVFQALADPKFGWDQAFLKKQLKFGTMKLVDLNPAQAVMVVNNLRGTHVKVSWTQSLFS